ncbi:MAG: hypothetical protein ABEJ65_10180 [bacterium]
MTTTTYCLLSLYNKDSYAGSVDELAETGQFELIGTSGTSEWCRKQGIECRSISDVIGVEPRMEGQVKSLHPDLYSGILAGEEVTLPEDIPRIKLLVVDLTPFEMNGDFRRKKVDIGGVSLIRAGVKNSEHVIPLTSPSDLKEYLKKQPLNSKQRKEFARRALERTLRYDLNLRTRYLETPGESEVDRRLGTRSVMNLRYGENPDQKASLKKPAGESSDVPFEQLGGKSLSYTNLIDVQSALRLSDIGIGDDDQEQTTVTLIKHTNPTGWGIAGEPKRAFERAWSGDPKSAFGGVVGCGSEVTPEMAREIVERFVEVVVAPKFDEEAIDILRQKENLRILQSRSGWNKPQEEDIRQLGSSVLHQTAGEPSIRGWETVAGTLTNGEQQALRRMWGVCRWVTSNAAVIGNAERALGVGAGQQSRVDAVKISADKVREHHEGYEGLKVMASDGFFPFPDNIDEAADVGVEAIVAPGGSKRDDEVIERSEKRGITLVFSPNRIFRH